MSCDNIKELLSSYIDNEVTNEEKEMVETHIGICSECLKELNEIKAIIKSIDTNELELPKNFKQELHNKLVEIKYKPKNNIYKLGIGLVASFIIVFIGISYILDNKTQVAYINEANIKDKYYNETKTLENSEKSSKSGKNNVENDILQKEENQGNKLNESKQTQKDNSLNIKKQENLSDLNKKEVITEIKPKGNIKENIEKEINKTVDNNINTNNIDINIMNKDNENIEEKIVASDNNIDTNTQQQTKSIEQNKMIMAAPQSIQNTNINSENNEINVSLVVKDIEITNNKIKELVEKNNATIKTNTTNTIESKVSENSVINIYIPNENYSNMISEIQKLGENTIEKENIVNNNDILIILKLKK